MLTLRASLSNALQLAGGNPPSEFRIFVCGTNHTTKGDFVFDEVAAKCVMAEYAKRGHRVMVDYAHASLNAENALDPAAAGKAAGWFSLTVRNGELWATDVRWTPAAHAALSAGEWALYSPTFLYDPDRRVAHLENVALENHPATYHLTPLVAAGEYAMDPSLIKKALDAIEAGDMKAALEILKGLIASAAGAPAEDVPADPAAEPLAAGDPANADPATPDPAEQMAASALGALAMQGVLTRLTGRDTPSAAIEVVEGWRRDSVNLAGQRAQLAAQRAALESSERDALGVRLVKCGRSPAEVWAVPLAATDPAKRKLRARLSALSIEELREEVALAEAGRRAPSAATPETPVSDADHGLTPFQLELCRTHNIPAEQYARLAARRDAAPRA